MGLRVELFGLRQKVEDWKDQIAQYEVKIESGKAELLVVQDRLAQSVLKTTELLDELTRAKDQNRNLTFQLQLKEQDLASKAQVLEQASELK